MFRQRLLGPHATRLTGFGALSAGVGERRTLISMIPSEYSIPLFNPQKTLLRLQDEIDRDMIPHFVERIASANKIIFYLVEALMVSGCTVTMASLRVNTPFLSTIPVRCALSSLNSPPRKMLSSRSPSTATRRRRLTRRVRPPIGV